MNRASAIVLVGVCALVAFWTSMPYAHCQIPCGIYNDELRVELIQEHIQTIEKSMTEIVGIGKESPVNYNQLVRWIDNKEKHADEIQEIVTQYFMTQRVKPVDPKDEAAYAMYVKQLSILHAMLVEAMKAKQTTDMEHVEKLKTLTSEFHEAYFGKADKEHLEKHHQ
jgi:nickel superoxide dismutase